MTKEEYLCCYGNVRDAMKNICLSCQENERCKKCDVFDDLHKLRKIIHEHFELVKEFEKYKAINNFIKETEKFFTKETYFSHIIKAISYCKDEEINDYAIHCLAYLKNKLYQYENIESYKLEDLKEGMWVWDDVDQVCLNILEVREEDYNKDLVLTDGSMDWFEEFEENRFYPLTKALCEVNER